jgi:hypothetical protein
MMRFRFSNVFGSQSVTFNKVTVALQEYSANIVADTLTQVTFGGEKSVTIAVGQEIWSDGIRLHWVRGADDPAVQGRNLAVSYSVEGGSGPMTYHSGANTTSYISAPGSGDHAADLDVFAFEFTVSAVLTWATTVPGITLVGRSSTPSFAIREDSLTAWKTLTRLHSTRLRET